MSTAVIISDPKSGQYLTFENIGGSNQVGLGTQQSAWLLDLDAATGATFTTLLRHQDTGGKSWCVSGDPIMLQNSSSCPLVLRTDSGFAFQIGTVAINGQRPITVVGPGGSYSLYNWDGNVILSNESQAMSSGWSVQLA